MRSRFLLTAAAVLILPLLAPADASGQPYADPGTGAGPLGFYAQATGGTQGTVLVGAQALTRFTGVLAAELFAGYRSDKYVDGAASLHVQQVPVQLSLIAYLLPNLRVQPYLLGGVGYYRIWGTGSGPQVQQENFIENKFAFHAGAGVDIRVARALSLRVEGRYVFLDVDAVTQIGMSANSWQAGGGFNVYF
ncbi:MAG TPA: OmpW family outer membrane protein [Thermoanaerobaculia bacterium]|nr:OmpW family outer membrane protein [Thermoanaerobaculia bacterium]